MSVATICLLACGSAFTPDVDQLLRLIVENEALYEDVEANVSSRFETPKLPPGRNAKTMMRWQEHSYVGIWQRGMYYYHLKNVIETYSGARREFISEAGYDGEMTRVNGQGQVGNLDDRRRPTGVCIPPHRLAMSFSGEFALADMISLSPSIRLFAPYQETDLCEARVEGKKTIHGIPCKGLHVKWSTASNRSTSNRVVYWIAPSRNYLVASMEHYFHNFWPTIDTVTEVTQWRELKPSIWCPIACKQVIVTTAKGAKHPVLESTTTFTVHSVNLQPKWDIQRFREIEMPRGMSVYVLKGGEIVDELIDGVSVRMLEKQALESPMKWVWLVVANAAIIAGVVIVMYFRRRRRRLTAS